jgi:hypothetical protein
MDLVATSKQLVDVDDELEALELQLQQARERKAVIVREREEQERQQQRQTYGGADELQRQIDELKQQLAQQELELKRNSTQSTKYDSITTPKESQVQAPPVQEVQCNSEYYEPVRGLSEQAKQKHSWEKPAWALPSEAIPDDSILKDSIQNPLLKAPTTGYERKVHEANIALIPGKFVQPTKAKVDPRMVWIVVNIDGCKVGKIVMHLYGNFLPLTDIFTELKGLEIIRCNDNTLVIQDIEPNFYVHVGTAVSFSKSFTKQASADCYGIVLEGQDILQQVFNAPNDAVLTVKQSHIFPVKKTK